MSLKPRLWFGLHPSVMNNTVKQNNCTCFVDAVLGLTTDMQKRDATVAHLLNTDDANINVRDKDGYSALMYAVTLGYQSTLQILLSSKNVNLKLTELAGNTCLHLAAQQSSKNFALLLLQSANERGTDFLVGFVEFQNIYGETAVNLALKQGFLRNARLISSYVAEVDAKSFGSLAYLLSGKSGRRLSESKHSATQTLARNLVSLTNIAVLATTNKNDIANKLPSFFDDMMLSPNSALEDKRRRDVPTSSTNKSEAQTSSKTSREDGDEHHKKDIRQMIKEKVNVESKNKVRRVFQVDVHGSPSSGSSHDLEVKPQIQSFSRNIRDLFKRRSRDDSYIHKYAVSDGGRTAASDLCPRIAVSGEDLDLSRSEISGATTCTLHLPSLVRRSSSTSAVSKSA